MFLRRLSRKHGRISKGALKGSLDSNPLQRGRPRKDDSRLIVTLDPNKFAEKKQRRLNISDLLHIDPRVSLLKKSSPVKASRMYYDASGKGATPYPSDTKAFLYYFRPREKPRIAGELRLRVTPSDDPASFESGLDLLQTSGRIWSRPLFTLSKFSLPLYEKLREEGFVPGDLHTVLSTFPPTSIQYHRSHLFYTLNDTFIVDFSKKKLRFCFVTEKGIEKSFAFFTPFVDFHQRWAGTPYTGSALARFERSTLLEHKGTRTIVLRFIKMLTPVKCVMPNYEHEGLIRPPKEGELHRRFRLRPYSGLKVPVWGVDIDRSKTRTEMERAFQLLWDA